MREQQIDAFPEDERRRSLRHDIPECYQSAERQIGQIGEQSKFFKDFAAYIKNLDVESDRKTVIDNLQVAKVKAAEMLELVTKSEGQLVKAAELEEEMADIEKKLGVPEKERWSGRKAAKEETSMHDDPPGIFDDEEWRQGFDDTGDEAPDEEAACYVGLSVDRHSAEIVRVTLTDEPTHLFVSREEVDREELAERMEEMQKNKAVKAIAADPFEFKDGVTVEVKDSFTDQDGGLRLLITLVQQGGLIYTDDRIADMNDYNPLVVNRNSLQQMKTASETDAFFMALVRAMAAVKLCEPKVVEAVDANVADHGEDDDEELEDGEEDEVAEAPAAR